jgi:CRISPR-associated protein Cas2
VFIGRSPSNGNWMPRRNRYTGILKPTLPGRGAHEVWTLLLYDVEDDRLRDRIAQTCMDYGLTRIQYSAFAGELNRNRRQELLLAVEALIGLEPARVLAVPVCAEDAKQAWKLDQYAGIGQKPPLSVDALARPRLRVIGADDDA